MSLTKINGPKSQAKRKHLNHTGKDVNNKYNTLQVQCLDMTYNHKRGNSFNKFDQNHLKNVFLIDFFPGVATFCAAGNGN